MRQAHQVLVEDNLFIFPQGLKVHHAIAVPYRTQGLLSYSSQRERTDILHYLLCQQEEKNETSVQSPAAKIVNVALLYCKGNRKWRRGNEIFCELYLYYYIFSMWIHMGKKRLLS